MSDLLKKVENRHTDSYATPYFFKGGAFMVDIVTKPPMYHAYLYNVNMDIRHPFLMEPCYKYSYDEFLQLVEEKLEGPEGAIMEFINNV